MPDAAARGAAFDGVTARRVPVLAGPGDRFEVVLLIGLMGGGADCS
jgi:hypothetical protein